MLIFKWRSRRLVARSLFDEESGEGAEDKGLDAAAEPVEVETGNGGNAHDQPGIVDAQVGQSASTPSTARTMPSTNQNFFPFFRPKKIEPAPIKTMTKAARKLLPIRPNKAELATVSAP